MIVKYYGRPRYCPETGRVTDLTSILTYERLDTQTLHDRTANPSSCIMLVPGTFDLEGRHVG